MGACGVLVRAGTGRCRRRRRTTARASEQLAAPLSFNRDIRPILSNNCFACHGPDEKQRETKFHFDTKEAPSSRKASSSPGDAAKSVLVKMITASGSGRADAAARLRACADRRRRSRLLQRWIDEGAKWDTHWAYTAPARPEPPACKDREWARNPIDHFILARLEREGLRAVARGRQGHAAPPRHLRPDRTAADAGRSRRVPRRHGRPTPTRSASTRCCASPHYGERMAMPWLDAARYADTHGYHIDSQRGMWPWRDWVIDAFNRNLPFDQFIDRAARRRSAPERDARRRRSPPASTATT